MIEVSDYVLGDGTPWRLFIPPDAVDGWAVLWLQGLTSTIEGHSEGCARMAIQTKLPFAILDYAGHGSHPVKLDNATRAQQCEEVIAVYDKLVRQGYQNIIVVGGSFGGYMAALLAGKRSSIATVLRAPANYADKEISLRYADTAGGRGDRDTLLYRQNLDEGFSNQAIEAVRSYKGWTYILEHGNDASIHPSIPRLYFSAAETGSYITIPGLEHTPRKMIDSQRWSKVAENWNVAIVKNITSMYGMVKG